MSHLAVRELTVQFPAVRALDDVSIEFRAGEVHGLVGENGAGKSTLMRVLSGLQTPSSGTVLIDDRPVSFRNVGDALAAGIAMIHQELNLVDELTVAENVLLGREPLKGRLIDRAEMNRRAAVHLEKVGAPFAPTARLGDLSLANQQLVEIAKALSYDARVLIMDEPTAVLSERETEKLFAVVRDLHAHGVTVIYVSHRLVEIEALCDRVTVLRDGRVVASRDKGAISPAEVANLMVGRELEGFFPPKAPRPVGEPILRVGNLSVRRGEIVGLAGLIGSGRSELAEALVGLRPATDLEWNGVPARFRSPRDAARHGVVYVSEDRKGSGLFLSLDGIENTTLANLKAYSTPLVSASERRRKTEDWVRKLGIRGSVEAPVLYLSGGNQQKIAIAKWLDLAPKLLILDEPTRGVDVGAKREIYNLVQTLAAEGLACIVISSELPELLGLCHRIAVMREGSLVGEVDGDEATEEGIMRLAAGVAA